MADKPTFALQPCYGRVNESLCFVTLGPGGTGQGGFGGGMELVPGPVEMRADVLALGACQPKYFRTDDFSQWLLALRNKFLCVLGLTPDHDIIFLTGSGTAGMEAVAANFLPAADLLAISSGQFGERMCQIAERRGNRFDRIAVDTSLSPEENLRDAGLNKYRRCFSTIAETTNGYFLDPRNIRAAGLPDDSLLLCDGITAAFVDDFDVSTVDALIIGSQKGLGLSPGMCFVVLSPKAMDEIYRNESCQSLYFDFKIYLDDMTRGQTPFTPNLSVLYQLDRALDDIMADGGLGAIIGKRRQLAASFRCRLDRHKIHYNQHHVSNCVTVINTKSVDAETIVDQLKEKHGITVATNSPPYKKTHFRVSHLGNNTSQDMEVAADAIAVLLGERS